MRGDKGANSTSRGNGGTRESKRSGLLLGVGPHHCYTACHPTEYVPTEMVSTPPPPALAHPCSLMCIRGTPRRRGAPTWGTCGAPSLTCAKRQDFFLCEELVGKTSIDFLGFQPGDPLRHGGFTLG